MGWGRGAESRPPGEQGTDQILGVRGWEGGQKGKPQKQLEIQVSEVGVLGEPEKTRAERGGGQEQVWGQ